MPAGPKRYCMGCGEQVDTHIADREGNLETRCLFCGLVLAVEKAARAAAPKKESPASGRVQVVDAADVEEELSAWTMIIADDSDFLREFMRKLILKKGLAHEVIACKDGQEFVAEVTRAMAADKRVDLAVLDLEMPIMDGITAARTLRAVEKKFDLKRKIPILFFSVHRCDEGLRKQLAQAAPASYINKGTDSAPEKLTQRVEDLVHHLLKKRSQQN